MLVMSRGVEIEKEEQEEEEEEDEEAEGEEVKLVQLNICLLHFSVNYVSHLFILSV